MATRNGNASNNTLNGTTAADLLNGLGGNDTLIGGNGNDTLDGGIGIDSMIGGAGNDTYIASVQTDKIKEVGGVGSGTDTVLSSITFSLVGYANVENLKLQGATNINGTGNELHNKITGNSGHNRLSGGAGNDTLDGGAGNDTLTGGAGNDTHVINAAGDKVTEAAGAGGGVDTVSSANRSLSLSQYANVENARLTGSADLNLTGNSKANRLTGNAGDNDLSGGGGNDNIMAGAGADSVVGGAGNDILDGQAGSDTVLGGDGNDTIAWDAADAQVDGGANTDTLKATGTAAIDLTALADGQIAGMEIVSLAGTNTLTLSAGDINDFFTDGIMVVNGGVGDAVIAGGGWTLVAGPAGYSTYTRSEATLRVQDGINTDGIGVEAISLAILDGDNGFRVDGIAGLDESGKAVASAGDFNGDGYEDFIIGAPGANEGEGQAYLVFGGSSFSADLDLSSLNGTSGFRLDGQDGRFGSSVSSAGDVNGDGLVDLIVGAPLLGDYNEGHSYVVFGRSTFGNSSLDVGTLDGTNGFRLPGEVIEERNGRSVSSAGDLNGDGYDDLVIGAPDASSGAAYVVFGNSSFSAEFDLDSLIGDNGFRIQGVNTYDSAGISVASAGDVNGDGIADLIIGASYYGDPYNSGESYVVYGREGGFGSPVELSHLDGTNGFRLNNVSALDESSGHSVASAGDINGDGYADLVIGAPQGYGEYPAAGRAYVVFGGEDLPASMDLASLNGSNGFLLIGEDEGDATGYFVSAAGDLNGDGYDDLVVGAPGADPGGEASSGATYVVFGKSGGFVSTLELGDLDGTDGFRLEGVVAEDLSGTAVSSAGDVNGDGYADLLIGTPGANGGAGASYVFFGRDFTGTVDHAGGDGAQTLTGGAGAEAFVGGRGNDVLIGGGGNDAFHAGAGDDVIVLGVGAPIRVDGGTGFDTVNADGFGGSIVLTGSDASVQGIEAVDLTGSAANTLVLTKAGVLNLSDTSNKLTVDGDAGDKLTLIGEWSEQGTDGDYVVWGNGQAAVRVDFDIEVTGGASGTVDSLPGVVRFLHDGELGAELGGSVSVGGDVNGDGFDDLLIGADEAHADNGAAYFVEGGAALVSSLDLGGLDGTNGVLLLGADESDAAGRSVSIVGDINGDGYADLLVGAPGADVEDGSGIAYLVFGGDDAHLASLHGTDGFVLAALDGTNGIELLSHDNAYYSAAHAVSGAGDFNGDGYGDLIVEGNYDGTDRDYIVFGGDNAHLAALQGADLDGIGGDDGFEIRIGGSWTTRSAGDVDGDGFDDLLVGAYGTGFLMFGGDGQGDIFDLESDLNGFVLDAGYQELTVASADINGDGRSDLILADSQYGDYNEGAAYILFGTDRDSLSAMVDEGVIDLDDLDGANGFILRGAAGDFAGMSVAGAGDVNGDGYEDIVIGAPGANTYAGAIYIVFGGDADHLASLNELVLTDLDGLNGFRVDGASSADEFGRAVSGAGDVNGDGYDDILVGAPGVNADSGASYLIYGSNRNGAVSFEGGTGADALAGTAGGDAFVGGLGDDTLISGGGVDAFHGGAGNDRIVVASDSALLVDGGGGDDTIAIDGAGASFFLAELGRVDGIERVSMGGSSANTLVLTREDVSGASDATNILKVTGDAGSDAVTLIGEWTMEGPGESYDYWVNGNAEVWIQQGLTVNFDSMSLEDLAASDGITLRGSDGERAGVSVAAAGDVDGDGYGDLIIGAPNNVGDSYVVYGDSALGASLDLSTLSGANGFVVKGANVDTNGYSAAGLGDVNGDGFADVISGAYGAYYGAGQSAVVFGGASVASSLASSNLDGTNGFQIDGAGASDFSGGWVSSAGDVNADGYEDILVGANAASAGAGYTYLVFGRDGGFPASIDLSVPVAEDVVRFDGEAGGDYSGRTVAAAGDINGDGFDDFVLGVGDYANKAYVVFGRSAGDFATETGLADNGFGDQVILTGFGAFGRTAAGAGDFNGDGFDEVIVGASKDLSYAGRSVVYFGGESNFLGSIDFAGTNLDDRSGFSVASAGDFNGDGYDDLIIGAFGVYSDAGASYVVFGRADPELNVTIELSSLNGLDGFRLRGDEEGDNTGRSVASAGDVNGDGYDDVIVGAPGGPGSDGASYVIYGSNRNGAVDFAGGAGNDALAGTEEAEAFVGGRGNDTMTGNGGADAFSGGAGNDVISIGATDFLNVDGGAGTDTLLFGGESLYLDFSGPGGPRVSGIEAVDMRGDGTSGIALSLADLLELSDTSNTLTIRGDAGDTVQLTTSGWLQQADEGAFNVWTQGAGKLRIHSDISLDDIVFGT